MRIGFTGSRGAVGSYLFPCIASRYGGSVRLFLRNVRVGELYPDSEVLCGDLLSPKDCERFVKGLNVIYYLAHCNTPVSSDRDPPNDALLNSVPLLNFLQAIRNEATKPHVIYFSSGGAIYGRNPERVPWRETARCQPISSYGIQKLAAEHYLRLAAEKGYLTCTALRVGNAYGTLLSPERMQGLVGVAINNALHNAPIRVFGNMDNVRDYVHLQDICAIAEKAVQPKEPFTILNVGSGQGYSVNDVLNIIQDCVGAPLQIERIRDANCGRWLGDWVVLDITKAQAEFQWTPRMDFRAGIQAMIVDARAGTRAQLTVT